MEISVSGRWTRVRTLGRGASGAVVWLAADEASGGALFAVKSAPADAPAGEQLRREASVLSALRSPHVVPCLGFRADDGECQLFLEYAPGGTLADAAAKSVGGRLPERDIRAYACDVARGLAYLHGLELVHGDVKARNVVLSADGRAMLADFGCARPTESTRPIGGTPAFMAPEVARGEEQGPAADVWALACTVVEMATGRAPWSDTDEVLAAVHRIGFTDAVPEVPAWLSAEAKHFLACCFARNPRDRPTAAQLLEHPFLASAGCGAVKVEEVSSAKWVSPKSTLDAALWESDTDDDEEEDVDISENPAQRIKALAGPCSALPDWDSDEAGWIQVLNEQCEACNLVFVPTKEAAEEIAVGGDECVLLVSEIIQGAEAELNDVDAERGVRSCSVPVGLAALSIDQQQQQKLRPRSDPPVFPVHSTCHSTRIEMSKSFLLPNHLLLLLLCPLQSILQLQNDSSKRFTLARQTKSRTHELVRCDNSRNIVLDTIESV
ncbi:hypothetical protein PR202_ga10006 [Eleusine coracana subsp. coracana]|uniref:Protein kinase domain-containing protein n=1 Tax=Eleusine coracana subsp. coracana TaxID=191504 RepID=A0AAV5C5M4_ELECO|nr:hypothetical protein PR202_ga10006 [Eleusine coracana subsp. coracana]